MIDFTTAWAVMKATKPEYHHEKCSFRVSNGGLLCDCAAMEAIKALDELREKATENAEK